MAVIRERVSASGTKSYHVQVRIKGFPPQTKTFPNKTMAKDWAAMVQTELKAGRYLPRVVAERHTVADLIERHRKEILPLKAEKFIRDQTVHLDWWEGKLGRYNLAELNTNLIAQARGSLSTESIGKTRVKVQTKDAAGKAVTTTVVKIVSAHPPLSCVTWRRSPMRSIPLLPNGDGWKSPPWWASKSPRSTTSAAASCLTKKFSGC